MKNLPFVLIVFCSMNVFGQIDTLTIRDTINPTPYVSGKSFRRISASNEYYNVKTKPIRDSLRLAGVETYVYTNRIYDFPEDRPYYLRFYINDTTLLLEGLYLNGFNYGVYKEYNKNGTISIKGNFNSDYVVKKNGKVKSYPQRDGVWEYYNLKGRIKRIETYENGNRIK